MIDGDLILNHAEELLRRVSPEGRARARRLRERRRRQAQKVMLRLMLAAALIVAAAGAVTIAIGILTSAMMLIAFALFIVAAIAITRLSREPEPTPEAIARTDLPLLPRKTEEWLERQRPALPPPATRLLDSIAVKLEAMSPQLEGLEPHGAPANAVRKLLCDELPELVKGYCRVPPPLRRQPGGNGTSPDRQLVDGLQIIDGEIARMTGQLASGDLDLLATRNRYLELKYRSGDELSGEA